MVADGHTDRDHGPVPADHRSFVQRNPFVPAFVARGEIVPVAYVAADQHEIYRFLLASPRLCADLKQVLERLRSARIPACHERDRLRGVVQGPEGERPFVRGDGELVRCPGH